MQRSHDDAAAAGTPPEAAPTATADAPGGAPIDPTRLAPVDPARYRVIGELARGGLGRIVEVRDLRIGRTVALKEMLADGEAAYARFVREATITARLEHPAIVPVHDLGRWPNGEPFYAMKRVSGRSLHELLLATPALEERLALLPNVIAVADAIAYAHSEGVIHRDLKPANVLVGAFGETVVIDWGLAKELAEDEPATATATAPAAAGAGELTVAGAVLGTPCYMPPEQARGEPVGPRADVYALGALLYEVLAGAPPYADARRPLEAVLAGPPAPIEARAPGVPPDLAAIAQKAMARDPALRYPSAREVAEDLRRFQTGRLVSAHAYSRRTLVRRWLRRYRAPVVVAAAALAVLAAAGAVAVQRVVAERDVARRRADQLLLAQARGALDRDATEALAWLRTYPAGGADPAAARELALEAASRGVARHVPPRDGFFAFTADGAAWIGAPDGAHLELRDAATGALVRRLPHRGGVEAIAALSDHRTVAVHGTGDTAVALVDLATGAARRLPAHPAPIAQLAASPDGRWLATGSSDGTVRLAPAAPGAGEGRALLGHTGDVFHLAFSRDGRWLLSMAAESAAARVWEVGGAAARVLAGVRDAATGDLSPDGALAALAHRDGAVTLWATATGERVREAGRHAGAAGAVAFSPDGRALASGGDDGTVLVIDVATGARRALTGHAGAVEGLAFSPDGAWLASGGADGEVRLWQVTGDEERVLGRHPGRVFSLAFSADGRRLATRTLSGNDGADARIWDVAGRPRRGLRCHRGVVFRVAVARDGGRMATTGEDGAVCLWDPRTGEARRLEGHDGIAYSVALSPDGARLASTGFDGRVLVWDLGGCAAALSAAGCAPAPRVLAGHRGGAWAVAFSPDGRTLASVGDDATVRLWDAATGAARALAGPARAVRAVAFSPDGRTLASAGEDREPWLWDVAAGTGAPLGGPGGPGGPGGGHADRINSVTFAPDGRALWTASDDQSVRQWDLATGASRALARDLGRGPVLAPSPDGRWLAVSGGRGGIALVDLATGAARTLARRGEAVNRLAFSPDGARLASGGRDRAVRLWDVRAGALDEVLRHDHAVLSLAFAPDGRWLAATGAGPVVRVWPTPPVGPAPRAPRELAAWIAARSTAAPPAAP